ncbi:hypothetical protein INT48_006286 [Thamnidium elegans]|uniref:BZIP domain-containing protein n=1 Tax=Thamnidium elegans TaxID=101142 RepID=A0A8H7SGS0_9FUNG|nr:hypothetical protein INT48_006286 [Thamnidium elegans]
MSYLNSDYMSSATSCWNPPTPSPTPTDQSPVSTPICQTFFDISSWNHSNTSSGENLLNEYPFMVTDQQYHTPYFHQPASPPSSSCSSDTEQTRKRRGRKKRDSYTPPLPPTMIAPAPVVKQLPTILPAQEERKKHGNVNKYIPVSKPVTDDSQKAATIAKRQERLIKNRAAALLSRKRKREHLTALEDQRNGLSNENNELKQRVLELEKENLALKKKLECQTDSKSVMIFMMVLFSFAYLVSMATKLVPLKYNTTFATKLPFTKTHDDSITFQLANYPQESNSFFKRNQKHSSLKRRRVERILM